MTIPPEMLERALAAHGDLLYRMALLLGGDEPRAETLLRAAVADLLAAGMAGPPDEPALLARLAAAARRQEAGQQERRPGRRTPAGGPPLHRSALALPLDQRLALGLALLAGYDLARAAHAAAVDEPAAHAALTGAVRALAPVAGASLTDRVSGAICDDVRAALIDPTGRQRHAAIVRGHLATCGACRSFDQTWGEVTQDAEAALRDALRERRLPAALAERLAGLARPARRKLSPSLRFAIPPLAVLALVAVLVLPGFTRRAVTVVDATTPLADPRALVALALDRYGRPPDRGPAVWHGRYETLWYFNDETVAPLHADIWLDRDNMARHRIQLAHAGGGAPYEQQVGNGSDTLFYALDASYAPSLYGNLAVRADPENPLLLTIPLGAGDQERALAERLRSGPWGIPPFYLRQAAQAGDLRALGRLSEGGRTVQVISFSGVSPLGLPADAPGATAERVTVMLAVDSTDGRLRSATEISGPPGGTQVSRVTWRLVEEQLLAVAQADQAFEIGRAWNGLGEFPERVRHTPADLGAPALALDDAADPASALGEQSIPLWMPARPPPGVDRAVLLWPEQDRRNGRLPRGLLYLGPERRLAISFVSSRDGPGAPEQLGGWSAWITPGRGRSYVVALQRSADRALPRSVGVNPFARMSMVAQGFTRDELAAIVEGIAPLSLDELAAQDDLFIYQSAADPAARAALIAALRAELGGEQVRYTRAKQFSRQNAVAATLEPSDPYHRPAYGGKPETTIVETWVADGREGEQVYMRVTEPESGRALMSERWTNSDAWFYDAVASNLVRYETAWMTPLYGQLSSGGRVALDALLQSHDGLTLQSIAGDRRLVRSSQPVSENTRYAALASERFGEPYMADLGLQRLVNEVELDADGQIARFSLIGETAAGDATPLIIYTVYERDDLLWADAPAELNGALPGAQLSRDWIGRPAVNSLLSTRTLTETLASVDYPFYGLPPDLGQSGRVQYVAPGSIAIPEDYNDLSGAVVGAGLGYRLIYKIPDVNIPAAMFEVRLTQGPAEPFKAFLAGSYARPWVASVLERLLVAGAEREVWVARGALRGYAFVDMGPTLLLAEAPIDWFDANMRGALAQLAPLASAE